MIDLTFLTAHSLRATPHDEATSLPKKIIYPINYVPLADPAHQRLFEGFVKRLEAYLGVKRVEVDLEKLWLTNSNVPLKEYLEKVPCDLLSWSDSWWARSKHQLTLFQASIWPLCEGIFQGLKQFWLDYHDKYECAPFLEEGPRLRWYVLSALRREAQVASLTHPTGTLVQTLRLMIATCIFPGWKHSRPGSIERCFLSAKTVTKKQLWCCHLETLDPRTVTCLWSAYIRFQSPPLRRDVYYRIRTTDTLK